MNNRFFKAVSELGCLDALLYGLARVVQLFGCRIHRYYFVAQRVATTPPRSGWGRAIQVRAIVHLADIPWGYPRPRDVLAERFRQGGHSLAAWRGNALAGFLWWQFGAYKEDEVRVRYCLPSPYSAWDYDVFVQPHLRLSPTFSRLWEEAHRRLHARGVRWTCSRISAFNPESLRAHSRLGTVRMGSATFLTIGPSQWMFATRPPFFHLSISDASYPQLCFDTAALERLPVSEALCQTGRS